jgi:hypothetical protein
VVVDHGSARGTFQSAAAPNASTYSAAVRRILDKLVVAGLAISSVVDFSSPCEKGGEPNYQHDADVEGP